MQLPAHGYAHIVLNEEENAIAYTVVGWKTTGTPTMAHFHTGARRVNGPPVKNLTLMNGTVDVGSWTTSDAQQPLTQEFINDLKAGRLYVNIHTASNPGGEIRGQFFMPEAFGTVASAEDEIPDPGKDSLMDGRAIGIFVHDALNNTLFYRATATNLKSPVTAAHIHNGVPGVAGPPVKNTNVDPLLLTTSGFWTPEDASQPFTAEQLNNLRTGQFYWNIHTQNHAPGQLRGQIVSPPGGHFFTALLSGAQESGGNPSTAEGTALLYVPEEMNQVFITVVAHGLTGPIQMAHIHSGKANVSSPPVVTLPVNEWGIDFEWTAQTAEHPLTPADIAVMFAGEYYINLHTQQSPAGEIRGQIIPLGQQPAESNVEFAEKTGEIGLTCSSNPARGVTTVHYDLPYPMRAEIAVYDVTGKCVKRAIDNGSKGLNSYQMQVNDLPAGAYLLKLQAGGESVGMNLIVSK